MDVNSSIQPPILPTLTTNIRAVELRSSAAPQVWFLTDGLSPIGVALSRTLLKRGDYVVSTILREEFKGSRGDGMRDLMNDVNNDGEGLGDIDDMDQDDDGGPEHRNVSGWKDRFKVLQMDAR
jgi:hypothetical protein